MTGLFTLLETRYPSAAQCAAALGLSRQAYSQARARKRLSESAAIRAAGILGIDPAAALLTNATAANPPAPILDTPTNPPRQPDVDIPTPNCQLCEVEAHLILPCPCHFRSPVKTRLF